MYICVFKKISTPSTKSFLVCTHWSLWKGLIISFNKNWHLGPPAPFGFPTTFLDVQIRNFYCRYLRYTFLLNFLVFRSMAHFLETTGLFAAGSLCRSFRHPGWECDLGMIFAGLDSRGWAGSENSRKRPGLFITEGATGKTMKLGISKN